MKYKREYEEKDLLNDISLKELAKITKLDVSYLYLLKKNKRVASYSSYKKIIKGINYINSGYNQKIDLSGIENASINLEEILKYER